MHDLLDKPIKDIASELRLNVIKAQRLAEAVIHNHVHFKNSLKAYKSWDANLLDKQAKVADAAFENGIDTGPLQGLPVSVKDLFGVNGFQTFAGTPKPLPKQWEQEGPVVSALRRQLAVITGKTHTVEFAFGGLGANSHWGTPTNPWDLQEHRVPGGSSSGAGVTLCVGSAILAVGSDTAGSIRIPASMTGNVGLKTSIGRWSVDGIVPLSPSLDTVGLSARSVEDISFAFFALESMAMNDIRQRLETGQHDVVGLRLGVCDAFFWDDCSPGVVAAVKTALNELSAKGARLVAIKIPEFEEVYPVFKEGGLAAPELYAFLKSELPEWLGILDIQIAQRMEDVASLTSTEYLLRQKLFEMLAKQVDQRLKEVDVLVSPTVAVTPPTLTELTELKFYRRANLLSLRNTCVVNYLRLCALTMPVGFDDAGMPVGLQLIARHGHEERLLDIARSCERCLGTTTERLGRSPIWS